MAEVKEKPKANGEHKAHELKRNDVTFAAQKFNHWFCGKIPAHLPVEQWLDPAMWAGASRDFSVYDRITCINADQSILADLMVVDKGVGWCRLSLMFHVNLPGRRKSEGGRLSGELALKFEIVPGIDGYRGRRKADQAWMGPWRAREEDANRDVMDHASLR